MLLCTFVSFIFCLLYYILYKLGTHLVPIHYLLLTFKKNMSNRQFESGASERRRKNIQNNELKKYKGLMNNFVITSGNYTVLSIISFYIFIFYNL